MDTDKFWDLPEFKHEPIKAVRSDVIGEVVMFDKWSKLMRNNEEGPFNAILGNIVRVMPGKLTERHATVAASFITWLGTNVGQGFLHNAKTISKYMAWAPHVYVSAWAVENQRTNGWRRIEQILSQFDAQLLPKLTTSDHETVELLVAWLGTTEGEAFLDDCAKAMSARYELLGRIKHAERELASLVAQQQAA